MQDTKSNASTATATAMTTAEASKMLEAALQQMDGIISSASTAAATGNSSVTGSGDHTTTVITPTTTTTLSVKTTTTSSSFPLSERNMISASNVLATAKTLALALQQVGVAAPAPDPGIAAIINDWLETHIPRQDADERLRRLQRDKESLALQYQMLAERVSEQTDKIIELEGLLTEKTAQLSAKDEQLQRQMLSRSALETQKLELMSALSELKLHRAALERENVELRGIDGFPLENGNGGHNDGNHKLPPQPYGSMGNLNQSSFTTGMTPKTPPASLRHQIQPQFHSLPRSHTSKSSHSRMNNSSISNSNNNNNNSNNNNNNINNNNLRSFDANANANANASAKQRNVAFASNEKILIDDGAGNAGGDPMYGSFISQANSTPSPTLRERSAKGLRSMLGRLRRSNSGNLELPALEQAEPEFKRGGARATTGGRIEWTTQSSQSQLSNTSKNYTEWTAQEVCDWLCDLGLGCYQDDCRKWLKANPTVNFFTASPIDIEKELYLKSPLHRKKIVLAMDELTSKEDDPLALKAAQLDVSWVLRWLDDIGLPQYKDTFLLAKVDGRMLHRLTLEDLAHLHVSSCLHIASLKRGIQCMREMNWDPECLIRRSTKSLPRSNVDEADNDSRDLDQETEEPTENIALWTAHRVMEWLRVADLSEYAPNLRGAGVHGALMLYEPLFNAELLADLLSISPTKTLLRRHLATHFKELLGRDVIQGKREIESQPGYQPLTLTAKLKPPKKTQFSLKRRKSAKAANEIDWTDYVCPMMMISSCLSDAQNQQNSITSSTSTNNSGSVNSN